MGSMEKCKTKLLPDSPALTDGFSSHQPIAQAIAELICTEQGGKYIGLEGDWGSGKSTVINLLKADLEADQETRVIVFDAWSHQGDPLRRSFLETLIAELGCWVNQRKWCKRREELAGRRETSRSTRSPVLFFWGKALIVSLLLITLVPTLLKAWLDRDLTIWWFGRTLDWTGTSEFLGSLFLLCLPLILIKSRQGCQQEKWKERILRRPRLAFLVDPRDACDSWCIFTNQYDSVTTSSSLKSADPTSVEFRRYFIRLMREALRNHPDGQVVLVLDNLDRIPRKDALSMWSTMQTFLSTSEYSSQPWFTRAWVIVPYDRNGINQLWDDKIDTEGESGDAKADDMATHFLDKSFQIVFHIPPLSLSDWRKYFKEELLDKAFEYHNDADRVEVCSLFAIMRENEGRVPTPRELVRFVNQVGALHRRYSRYEDTLGEISLLEMAYYVLLRKDKRVTNDSLMHNLRTGEGLAHDIDARFGKDRRVCFAAMLFGVDIEYARQILLREPIQTALDERRSEELKQYASYPGFWDVLEIMQIGALIRGDGSKLANYAYCLTNLEIDIEQLRSERQFLVDQVAEGLNSVKSFPGMGTQVAEGICASLRLIKSKEAGEHALAAIQASGMEEPVG